MYRIELKCNFEELWRYNSVITCGGYDATREQLYVSSVERMTSSEFHSGATVSLNPPMDQSYREPLLLECDDAESIEIHIYIVPHTLPLDRIIDNSPPFIATVTVVRGDEHIYSEDIEVNQWGGVSLKLIL